MCACDGNNLKATVATDSELSGVKIYTTGFASHFIDVQSAREHQKDYPLLPPKTAKNLPGGNAHVCYPRTFTSIAFEIKSLSVAWNNTFRKTFNSCWRESPRSLQFYYGCLPACYLIDQRRLLFWKKMLTSNNVLLRILARLCQQ